RGNRKNLNRAEEEVAVYVRHRMTAEAGNFCTSTSNRHEGEQGVYMTALKVEEKHFKTRKRTFTILMVMAVTLLIGVATAQTRPVVGGNHGMVASNHPQASFAGIEMLTQGGNAIDAAVATAAALGVVEPYLSGLGGDGFMLVYDAETEEINFLNFNARSPNGLSVDNFADQLESNDGRIDRRGPLNSLIPGAAAGWAAAQERYGTLDAAELLEPAIRLARDGYPATAYAVNNHSNAQAIFLDWDEAGA